MTTHPPQAQGLYDPRHEHDACGVGFVAHITGQSSHGLVEQALALLINLEHRGAAGADPHTGDGAGILVQMPDAFLRGVVEFPLPPAGQYGAGLVFLPVDDMLCAHVTSLIEKTISDTGLRLLGWRTVPTRLDRIGTTAAAAAPRFMQLFVTHADPGVAHDPAALERALFVLRKRMEHRIDALLTEPAVRRDVFIVSLSARTLIYKGMLTAAQLGMLLMLPRL